MGTIKEYTTRKGTKVYHATVRIKGHPTECRKLATRRDAERWIKKIESDIYSGLHNPLTEAKKHTIGDMIDRYISELKETHPKNAPNTIIHLQWWKERLGAYALLSVTPALIAKHKETLGAPDSEGRVRAAGTVNRYLAALSRAYTVAIKEWHWLTDNPLSRVTKRREPRGRVRYLSDKEREALLAACERSNDSNLLPIVLVALGSGMRLGEILSLTWDRVDLSTGVIQLEDTKNGERRRVTIAGRPLTVLREHSRVRHIGIPQVFPKMIVGKIVGSGLHNPRNAWNEAIRVAEIENFRFHDLRHTFASYMAMNGANLLELSELLGHKTVAMVKRYAHLSESHTAKLVETMTIRKFG